MVNVCAGSCGPAPSSAPPSSSGRRHTAHATGEEAERETLTMLEVYREFVEEYLAVPLIYGRKTAAKRFPGADETYAIEGLMADGRALQCGTSHFLGQNFAKAFEIRFLDDRIRCSTRGRPAGAFDPAARRDRDGPW